MASQNQQFISLKNLAHINDMTERRVQQLAKEGITIPGDVRGQYLFPQSVRNYVKYLHQRDTVEQRIDYTEHRARKMKAEADLVARKNEIELGEYSRNDEFEEAQTFVFQQMRQLMIEIVEDLKRKAKLRGKAAEEIDAALIEGFNKIADMDVGE